MSQLKLIDKIQFLVGGEFKTIELYYGDVTLLPKEEEADLLMLSAYHGDYTPTPSSLIGALWRKFKLLVGNLAQDKEEDLRRLFYCWWSKPLAEHLPYRRILCFETSRSGVDPQKAVQAIFKALVPACSLFTNGVIISPLLSTGDQGHSETTMLTAMVKSAVLWMENGLNIKTFKLVIYRGDDSINKIFKDLKRHYHQEPHMLMRFKAVRAPTTEYDFYVSADSNDQASIDQVKLLFIENKDSLKFYVKPSDKQLSEEQMFYIMKRCSRVLTFLSPAYLENDDCVEEYNAAWCLNKNQNGVTRLAPLLCQQIPGLPTYMSLIQWIDIRIRDGNTEKMVKNITLYIMTYIQDGSEDIIKAVQDNKTKESTNKLDDEDETNKTSEDDSQDKYDIFISYAHADGLTVNNIVKTLQKCLPDVKLFLDREELHTGGSWQERLYHCVEASRLTLSCLSPSYLKSSMCNEEFRISLARHFTEDDYHLVPIQITDCQHLPDSFISIRNTSLDGDSLEHHIEHRLVPALREYLTTGTRDGFFIPITKRNLLLSTLLEDGRCTNFGEAIHNEPKLDIETIRRKEMSIEILVSKDASDVDIAEKIQERLSFLGFKVEISVSSKDTAAVLKKLDSANLIIALISSDFIINSDSVDQLQVAINRHRYSKDGCSKLYPVLMTNTLEAVGSSYHIYFDLLRYECCFTDSVWTTWTIDDIMRTHPNYQSTMTECEKIQERFSKDNQKMLESKGEAAISTKKLKKDLCIKNMKFTSAVANRAAYHVLNNKGPCEVLVDVFTFVQKVVDEQERQKAARDLMLKQIQNNYSVDHYKKSPTDKSTQSKTRSEQVETNNSNSNNSSSNNNSSNTDEMSAGPTTRACCLL